LSFVEFTGLSKHYGDAVALDAIDLAIPKGALVCLLGPSGCGKTTTLRLVAGFVEPTAGEIRVGGRTISSPGRADPPERRGMSMIFQSYALWPHLSVFENVAYGLKLRGLDRATVKSRVEAILGMTKLGHLAQRYPGELSGGQQQRVALARALVVAPETLLLDEPLSNLDANLREEMLFEIRRLHEAYRYTTIYVTHDQTEAMTTADMIVVMNLGKIEQAGSPEDIYERPRSEFVARFIGGTNILKGQKVAGDGVDVGGGLVLRCGGGAFADAHPTAVSIRHHDIRLTKGPVSQATNAAPGTVTRQVYRGAHRDYLVQLATGDQIRALTPADVSFPQGEAVWLEFPRERCRALAA
jgi:iron(III) transport system ATP-binding protein